MSVRQALLSLRNSSKPMRLVLALAVSATIGGLAVACSAHDDTEAQYQEVTQGGRDRLPMRLYQK